MNESFKSKESIVYIIIFLIGIITIIVSFFIKQIVGNILVSIGTSIIAACIIYFLLNSFVGDPLKPVVNKLQKVDISLRESVNLLEQASKTGVVGVWSKRGLLDNNIWIKKIEDSKENIDILGYAVAFLPDHPDFKKIIQEKYKQNCKIRILLGKPNCSSVSQRNIEEKEEGSITSRIETSLIRLNELIKTGCIEVRLHDTPLYCSIYRFDSEMLVTPHLYGVKGSAAPLFSYKNVKDGIFQSYLKHFDDIWNLADEYKGNLDDIQSSLNYTADTLSEVAVTKKDKDI